MFGVIGDNVLEDTKKFFVQFFSQVAPHFLARVSTISQVSGQVPVRGDGGEQKRRKTKIFVGTPLKLKNGWPKRLGLVRATPLADFAVIGDQL